MFSWEVSESFPSTMPKATPFRFGLSPHSISCGRLWASRRRDASSRLVWGKSHPQQLPYCRWLAPFPPATKFSFLGLASRRTLSNDLDEPCPTGRGHVWQPTFRVRHGCLTLPSASGMPWLLSHRSPPPIYLAASTSRRFHAHVNCPCFAAPPSWRRQRGSGLSSTLLTPRTRLELGASPTPTVICNAVPRCGTHSQWRCPPPHCRHPIDCRALLRNAMAWGPSNPLKCDWNDPSFRLRCFIPAHDKVCTNGAAMFSR